MINIPKYIEFELTSKCTLFCPECPRTRDDLEINNKWKSGELPLITFEKMLKQIPESTQLIFSGGYGDPIYHSNFIEIIELCKLHNKKITVDTNGSYRSKNWWLRLAETIDESSTFNFSVDGLEDTSHIYRINNDWPSIMLGMETMAKHAKCRVAWKYIVFRQNQHQVEEAFLLAKGIGLSHFRLINSGRPYPPGMQPTIDFKVLEEKINLMEQKYNAFRS